MCARGLAGTLILAASAAIGLGLPEAMAWGRGRDASQSPSSRPVRVALGFPRGGAALQATGAWELLDPRRRVMAAGQPAEAWRVETERGRWRAVGVGGEVTPWQEGAATLRVRDSTGFVAWNGRSYRGELVFVPAETSLVVVNRLDVEDYLRGVVPLEVGTTRAEDHAAVEAQAVAARSFTYSRMLDGVAREFDLTASEADQVYGGAGAENFLGDLAVAATAGWVLGVDGRVVIAPYHAVCGGHTAAPTEVWRTRDDGYLRGVSDRIPGGDRVYCDIAPRFAWERRVPASALPVPPEPGPGARALREQERGADPSSRATDRAPVRSVRVGGATRSGRVRDIEIETERGNLTIRGNEIRSALDGIGGDILPSTYFSLEPETDGTGRLVGLLVRGRGNGHGVGMCQWGAIGRARAGHDFRAILRAYYPGAQLLRAP